MVGRREVLRQTWQREEQRGGMGEWKASSLACIGDVYFRKSDLALDTWNITLIGSIRLLHPDNRE